MNVSAMMIVEGLAKKWVQGYVNAAGKARQK